jgi:hypothetical protein
MFFFFFFFLAIKLLICLQVLQFILLLFVSVNFQLFVEIIAKIPKNKKTKKTWDSKFPYMVQVGSQKYIKMCIFFGPFVFSIAKFDSK